MGTSSDLKSKKVFDYRALPNDQYVCTDCNNIPEIINVDYDEGIITFKCKTHGTKKC